MSVELVHRGYTQLELLQTFDNICDPIDWKKPIEAIVMGQFLHRVVAAIEFYTATNPTVTPAGKLNRRVFRVKSEGYRQGPAGP